MSKTMTDDEIEKYHVYSNGTDWLVGTSADEAIAAYCAETGDDIAEYTDVNGQFHECDEAIELTIHDDCGDEPECMTIREWIRYQLTMRADGSFSRMLCSTEY